MSLRFCGFHPGGTNSSRDLENWQKEPFGRLLNQSTHIQHSFIFQVGHVRKSQTDFRRAVEVLTKRKKEEYVVASGPCKRRGRIPSFPFFFLWPSRNKTKSAQRQDKPDKNNCLVSHFCPLKKDKNVWSPSSKRIETYFVEFSFIERKHRATFSSTRHQYSGLLSHSLLKYSMRRFQVRLIQGQKLSDPSGGIREQWAAPKKKKKKAGIGLLA